jgi:hypothetical protein
MAPMPVRTPRLVSGPISSWILEAHDARSRGWPLALALPQHRRHVRKDDRNVVVLKLKYQQRHRAPPRRAAWCSILGERLIAGLEGLAH